MNDHQLGSSRVIIYVCRFAGEKDGLEITLAPDIANTAVQFHFSFDKPHRPNFVSDYFVDRRLSLESIPMTIIFKKPAFVGEPFRCFSDQGRVIIWRQHSQSQVSWIDT